MRGNHAAQIVGFAWCQGTSDKAPDAVAEEYKFNLPDLIGDLRAEFGKPELPVMISEDIRGFHETVANSPNNQSFHWIHNARSYFRVGLSLGNQMKTLLTTP